MHRTAHGDVDPHCSPMKSTPQSWNGRISETLARRRLGLIGFRPTAGTLS